MSQRETSFRIHQIFYDAESKSLLDPRFIPLDNTENLRPDWFEFWVILNFLRTHRTEPNTWYGFLSPKFKMKTGMSADDVMGMLRNLGPRYGVALFTSHPHELVLFQNPFIQGDIYHEGLLDISQEFFDVINIKVDLRSLVTCLHTSVFSNYIIAKDSYWRQWKDLAERFFDYVEHGREKMESGSNSLVPYDGRLIPMKTFIQERLSTVILSQQKFKTFVPNSIRELSETPKIIQDFWGAEFSYRDQLVTLDRIKQRYIETRQRRYREDFQKLSGLLLSRTRIYDK